MTLNLKLACFRDPEDELYTEDNDIGDLTEEELITVDHDENPETSMWT